MRNFVMKCFLEKKCEFFFIFVYCTNFSVFLSKDFPQNCQNWILRVHRKPWKEYIFFEKNVSCSYRFRKWAKKFRPSRKTFWQGCANCFRPVDGFIFRNFFEKESDTFYHSRTLSKPFSAFSRKFFSRVLRKNYLNFQSLPDIEQKVFLLLSKKLQQFCQNCILRVCSNSLNEIFSWKKVIIFFYIIRTLSEKILAFYQIFFEGVVKSVFYISMGRFRRKIFSLILFRLSIRFRKMTGKKIRFSFKLFSAGLKKLHFMSQ